VPHLILSDIHGNKEALDAVLASARGRYDRILCLGDLAGYGADPNAVIGWARANATAVVRGNHDKACANLDDPIDYFHPAAYASAIWTRAALTTENREYLERLPRGPLRYEDFDLVHGSPLDEDEYLITPGDVASIREFMETRLTFFGHSHVQGGFLVARAGVMQIAPLRTLEFEPDHVYLINPGSVGQPRDGDPRAAYALYSSEERTVEYRRAAYDIDAAAAKIKAAGLPDSLAARLYRGL
jgi:diadenosine tetraphosphatase ApaH/serine/threonine PP2A family protein phosphatase